MLIHRSQSICKHAHKCNLTIINVQGRLGSPMWDRLQHLFKSKLNFFDAVSNFFANHASHVSVKPPVKPGFKGIIFTNCVNKFLCVFVWERLIQNVSYVLHRIVIQLSMDFQWHEFNKLLETFLTMLT